MSASLLEIVESTALDADEITAGTKQIHADIRSKSSYIDAPNFTSIHPDDLELLFKQYDSRINKRATVLVEDRKGVRYSDGKHYAKFYVPVQMLEAVE